MRLLSLTVRNYRLHRETVIEFDANRNLIGGPNESGKSTLVEAAHRALFLRAKTGGALQKEMTSSIHLGDPEVVLRFEAAGSRWELEKRFAGASKGSARLTREGGATFRDDEAEAQLAELLQITSTGSRAKASELPTLWSHLWVWQGWSGQDPGEHAAAQHDRIVRHLQQNSVSSLLESLTDQQAAERIEALWSVFYTPTGKPKAGSPQEEARLEFEKAEAAAALAQEAADRLARAVEDHSRAEAEITSISQVLPGLRQNQAITVAKIQQAAELSRTRESQHRIAEAAQARCEELEAHDRAIRDLREKLARAEKDLAPADAAHSSLSEIEQAARSLSESADAAHQLSTERLRSSRLVYEAASAAVISYEKEAAYQALLSRSAELAEAKAKLDQARAALASIPVLTSADVTRLRTLDSDLGQAAAALEAIATGIELIGSPDSVELDGNALPAGEEHILTTSGELVIGGATRLRIRPGGGKSLESARDRLQKCRGQLQAALDSLALQNLDHAVVVLEQRRMLEQQIHGLDTRWQALGGTKIATELDQASAARDEAHQNLSRRQEMAGSSFASARDLESSRTSLASITEALHATEAGESNAAQNATRLRQRLQEATAEFQRHREAALAALQHARDLATAVRTREESHGDGNFRTSAIAAARENRDAATAQLKTVTKALAELQSDLLQGDAERLNRAIATQEQRLREAENQRLVARDRLTLDGSVDPHAELIHARTRLERTRERHRSELHRAQAIERLHQLFHSSRESLHLALIQPLADRINGYLRCLFGPGAEARIQLTNEGLKNLDLVRTGDAAFSFATLSGGAREQVAAAVRLAIAEILATGHDGCLPVIFDDAFAYSDPARLGSLQRMLDLAASRGLQMIVLTCAPADYSGMGAKELRI